MTLRACTGVCIVIPGAGSRNRFLRSGGRHMIRTELIGAAVLMSVVIGFVAGCSDSSGPSETFALTSSAFAHEGTIPAKHTCDGAGVSPHLKWVGAPGGVKNFALIVNDPDAPGGTWDHWVLFNIPPGVNSIAEGSVPAGAVQGSNSWGRAAYGGPCPPSGTHRYYFKLYALDAPLGLSTGATSGQVLNAMAGHVLGEVQFMGRYR